MVTHDPEEAMFMADRIVVLDRGGVAQDAPPEEIYARPASAFVATMFGQTNEVAGRVAGGAVETPFGQVPAPGHAEGGAVRVLVRPEALRLSEASDDALRPARVIASRLLGRSSWVHLCLGAAEAPSQAGSPDAHHHIHARVPGRFLPPEGAILDIGLDLSQAFVFPANEPK
jgi:iron(III) transport system ATP-binding protein